MRTCRAYTGVRLTGGGCTGGRTRRDYYDSIHPEPERPVLFSDGYHNWVEQSGIEPECLSVPRAVLRQVYACSAPYRLWTASVIARMYPNMIPVRSPTMYFTI